VKLSLAADADALGQFVGWLGAGALTSAVALVWMNRAQAWMLYLSAALLPSCFVILASTGNVMIADLVGCLFGLALVQYLVRMSVLLQTVVAPENRGSVTGLYSMCLIGATPISVLFSGALAQFLDVNAALRIGAALALIGFVFLVRAAPASGLYTHSKPRRGSMTMQGQHPVRPGNRDRPPFATACGNSCLPGGSSTPCGLHRMLVASGMTFEGRTYAYNPARC